MGKPQVSRKKENLVMQVIPPLYPHMQIIHISAGYAAYSTCHPSTHGFLHSIRDPASGILLYPVHELCYCGIFQYFFQIALPYLAFRKEYAFLYCHVESHPFLHLPHFQIVRVSLQGLQVPEPSFIDSKKTFRLYGILVCYDPAVALYYGFRYLSFLLSVANK